MISRDEILQFLIEEFQKHFPDVEIDLSKSDILSWFMKTVAILDESILSYMTLLRNESFLSTAVYPSSIKNHAANLGFVQNRAIPASGVIQITIPLSTASLHIVLDPFKTKFTTEDKTITYTPKYRYEIQANKVTKTLFGYQYDFLGNKKLIPVEFTKILKEGILQDAITFYIDVQQVIWKVQSKVVGVLDSPYEFVDLTFPRGSVIVDKNYQLGPIYAFVNDREYAIESYTPLKDRYCYKVLQSGNQVILRFFPNILGAKGLSTGDKVLVYFGSTLGSRGNISDNQLTIENFTDINGRSLEVIIKHSAINNGRDEETIEELRDRCLLFLKNKDTITHEKSLEDIIQSVSKKIKIKPFTYVNTIYGSYVECQLAYLPDFTTPIFTNSVKLIVDGNVRRISVGTKFSTEQYDAIDNSIDFRLVSNTDQPIWQLPFSLEFDADTCTCNCYYNLIHKIMSFTTEIQNVSHTDNLSYIEPIDCTIVWDPEIDKYIFTFSLQLNGNLKNLDSVDVDIYFEYANQLWKLTAKTYYYNESNIEYNTHVAYNADNIQSQLNESEYFLKYTKDQTVIEIQDNVARLQLIVDPVLLPEDTSFICKIVCKENNNILLKARFNESVVVKKRLPFFNFIVDAKKETRPVKVHLQEKLWNFYYRNHICNLHQVSNTDVEVHVDNDLFCTLTNSELKDDVLTVDESQLQLSYHDQYLQGFIISPIKIEKNEDNKFIVSIGENQYTIQLDDAGYVNDITNATGDTIVSFAEKRVKLSSTDNPNTYQLTIDDKHICKIVVDKDNSYLKEVKYKENNSKYEYQILEYDFTNNKLQINYNRPYIDHYVIYKCPVIDANLSLKDIQTLQEDLQVIYDTIKLKLPFTINLSFVFAKTFGYLRNMKYNKVFDEDYMIKPYEIYIPVKLKILFKGKLNSNPSVLKNEIYKYVKLFFEKNSDFLSDNSISPSKIEQFLHNNIPELDYVKVQFYDCANKPIDKAIVYNLDLHSLPLEDKLSFVYEYLYTKDDLIEVSSL